MLFALDVRNSAIRDKAARIGVVQGFNDFFAEEYCAVDRDRLIGMAVLPNSGVAEDIAEMERCKHMGLKGAWLSTFPSGKGFPTPDDDRFWAAALDLEMPLVIHTGFPTKVGSRETPLLNYPKEPQGEQRPPTDFVQRFARQAPHHSGSVEVSQIIIAGVFDRFPRLQIIIGHMGEALPFWAYRLDYMHRATVLSKRYESMKPIKKKPSDYLRENFFITNSGVAWEPAIRFTQSVVGVDRVLYAMDYPYQHQVDEVIALDNMSMPAGDKKKFFQTNAEKVFKIT